MNGQRTLAGAVLTLCLIVAATTAQAFGGMPELANLAEKAGKAVVNISTTKHIGGGNPFENSRRFHPRGGPWDEFFDQFDRNFKNQPQRQRKEQSLGSGFIVTDDGYIVTNNHVVENADEIKVTLQQGKGKSYPAKLVGRDPETDLAVLKIDAKSLPTLSLGDSDKARVGDWVVAIGNPFGLSNTVTAGIVSAKGRVIGAGAYDDFIQTDASINPGNSGGPLINLDGDVIGINTAIVASGQGIGFAVPSNMAKRVVSELKSNKKVKRGWLGVSIQDVDEKTAKALGLSDAKGALVAAVTPGDPADAAGVLSGDVITEVNGRPIESASDLTKNVADIAPGETAKVLVWRKGDTKKLSVKLGERDSQKLADVSGKDGGKQETAALGLTLKPVTDKEARALGLEKPSGLLIVDVADGSAAADADLKAGDVLLEANQQPVNNVGDFKEIVQGEGKKKGVLMLLIKRKGHNFFKTLTVE
jgi:serine protease Do